MIIVTNENFPDLYAGLKNSVYSIAYNYVVNADDASDIMQETFIKLLKCQQEFNDEEHIKAWVIRVCINASLNFLRDNKNHKETELIDTIPYYDEEKDNSTLQMVLSLPEKYRIPIHLFYYEDYSVNEISEILNLSESTTKSRLKRGRDMLKKLLAKGVSRYV